MEFIVKNYRHEPFSASIWSLMVPSLGVVVQCIEPLGRDYGDIVKDSTVKGDLVLEMARVSLLTDADSSPYFSILEDNWKLSDGSRMKFVGKAKDIQVDDQVFNLVSTIELAVQAEVLPRIKEGDTVEVVGLLNFKPNLEA